MKMRLRVADPFDAIVPIYLPTMIADSAYITLGLVTGVVLTVPAAAAGGLFGATGFGVAVR